MLNTANCLIDLFSLLCYSVVRFHTIWADREEQCGIYGHPSAETKMHSRCTCQSPSSTTPTHCPSSAVLRGAGGNHRSQSNNPGHGVGSRGGILLTVAASSTLIMHRICIIESTVTAKELLWCHCNHTDIMQSQHCSNVRSLLCKIWSKGQQAICITPI